MSGHSRINLRLSIYLTLSYFSDGADKHWEGKKIEKNTQFASRLPLVILYKITWCLPEAASACSSQHQHR